MDCMPCISPMPCALCPCMLCVMEHPRQRISTTLHGGAHAFAYARMRFQLAPAHRACAGRLVAPQSAPQAACPSLSSMMRTARPPQRWQRRLERTSQWCVALVCAWAVYLLRGNHRGVITHVAGIGLQPVQQVC